MLAGAALWFVTICCHWTATLGVVRRRTHTQSHSATLYIMSQWLERVWPDQPVKTGHGAAEGGVEE